MMESRSKGQTAARSREKRWIVLAEDGRHSTIGRHTDPTEDDLERAAASLRAASLGGWLAVMEGEYYGQRSRVELLQVRELNPSRVRWEDAETAFHHARKASVGA